MTVSPVLLATGVILQAWSITTTASALLGNFVRVNLGPLSVGQDVAVKPLGLGVERNVVYVLAVSIVLMIPSMSREYHAMPGIIVQWVRQCRSFAQEEHIALVQQPHPYPAQVCAYCFVAIRILAISQ